MILKMILEMRSTLTKKTLTLTLQKSTWTCTSMGAGLCPNMDTHTHTSTSTMVACDGQATPLLKLYLKHCLTWYDFPSWLWTDPHIMCGQGMGPMNHDGVHMVIMHGGLPHGSAPHRHGVSLPWGHISTRNTHFMDSPSSSLSGRLGLHHGSARVHCSNGGRSRRWCGGWRTVSITSLISAPHRFLSPLYPSPCLVLKSHHLFSLSRCTNKGQPFSLHQNSLSSVMWTGM